MRRKRRYDDKFRASAVVMLQAAGYPGTKGALRRVATHLKMPESTLHSWANGSNPAPSDIRCEKKEDLTGYILAELGAILGEMPNARSEASFRDLAVAFGIMTDKLQLLTGEPTDRTDITSAGERLGAADDRRVDAIVALFDRARARVGDGPDDGGSALVSEPWATNGGPAMPS